MSANQQPSLQFVVSSLEAGKDGVGDYTLSLAQHCVSLGSRCEIIAANDHYTQSPSHSKTAGVSLHRLPASTPWAERSLAIKDLSESFAPDWSSLQFVSYGYHPKGLVPPELALLLKALTAPKRHVMMHEIWIGVTTAAPLKERLIGFLQRRAILKLLRQYDAHQTHTSNEAYVTLLGKQSLPASILPLFGNIPIQKSSQEDQKAALRRVLAEDQPRLVAVTFGTLHPQWESSTSARWFKDLASREGKPPLLLALGRVGPHAEGILKNFQSAGIQTIKTGELPSAEVSRLMQIADFGIAPHPWALIRKSGAAAAMIDHGLPIMVPRDDWQLRGTEMPAQLSEPLFAKLASLQPSSTEHWLKSKRPPSLSLPTIAALFLQSLQNPTSSH